MILSLPDAIAQLLERHMNKEQQNLGLDFSASEPTKTDDEKIAEDMESASAFTPPPAPKQEKSLADMGEAPACPECGSMLQFQEGCLKCGVCGHSKCA